MKPKDRKVTITCTEKQLVMLEMVCERYTRLIEGQLGLSLQDICEDAWCRRNKTKEHPLGIGSEEWYNMRHELEERLKDMEWDYWGLAGGRYNGIGYDDWADSLWDMYQVMRYARWQNMPPKEKESMRITVMSNTPMRCGSLPLIEVKYEEEDK